MWEVCECEPSDELKKKFLPGSGINHRIRAALKWYKDHPDGTAIADVLDEALAMIIGLGEVGEKLEEAYKDECLEFYRFRTAPRVHQFPVAVGDTVKSRCVEEDEHGNPVVTLVPWEVKGVAYKDGKYYAIDDSGELYECGTAECIIPEPRKAGNDIW